MFSSRRLKAVFDAWKYNRYRCTHPCHYQTAETFTVEVYDQDGWEDGWVSLLTIDKIPQTDLSDPSQWTNEYAGQSFFLRYNKDLVFDKIVCRYQATDDFDPAAVVICPRESCKNPFFRPASDSGWQENGFHTYLVYCNGILKCLSEWLTCTTQKFSIALQITDRNFEEARQDADDPFFPVPLAGLRHREEGATALGVLGSRLYGNRLCGKRKRDPL